MQPAQSPAFPFDPLGHYKAKDVVLAFSKHTPQATPTGYVYFVPLPKDVDSDWCVALEYQGESQGIVMDWFHRADLERFSGRTEAFLDNFLPGNYRRGAGDSVLPETSLYMMEAVVSSKQASTAQRLRNTDMRTAAQRGCIPLHQGGYHRPVGRPDIHKPPAPAVFDAKGVVRLHGESGSVGVPAHLY